MKSEFCNALAEKAEAGNTNVRCEKSGVRRRKSEVCDLSMKSFS